MSNKNGILRFKCEFENTPIFDLKKPIKNEAEFDTMLSGLKNKLFGK